MAVYHVPLYPSHRPFEGKSSVAGRLHWQPLFEAHGVNLAFENHDHALKRTHPLKGGEIVAPGEGVVYLGDGCWGLGPRSVEPRRWYEAHAESTRHFWAVEVDEQGANCRAIGQNGEILDQVHVPLRDEN